MIDLQIHTTDSDGTWAWDKVLAHCMEMGLKAFAITDHDTVIRRDEILEWGKKHNQMAIPGIELSTTERGQTVHLLGYFLDGPLEKLKKKLDYLNQARSNRNDQIVNKLKALGHDVTVEEVRAIAGTGTMGRPHIARLLMNKGIVKSMPEAFDRYLALNGAAYFPKEEVPLRDAIDELHQAGAVTSVAHPGLLKRTPSELETSLQEWRDWGLDAVEAIYPSYKENQISFFERMSAKYGFLKTGGSDFHGENKPYIKIGTGTGQLNVPDELLEPLLERRVEINKALV